MPSPLEPELLAAGQGFELRLLDAGYDGAGQAQYKLELQRQDDGRLAAVISVDAQRLSRTALRLSIPAQYSVSEGEYGAWPQALGQVSHELELGPEGTGELDYAAALKPGAPAGVDGAFELLRVVLLPAR